MDIIERHGHYCITGTDLEETISNHIWTNNSEDQRGKISEGCASF